MGHKNMTDDNTDNSSNNSRMFSAVQSFWKKLSCKLNKPRRGPLTSCEDPVFLIQFYCVTTFTKVTGQTGGWDIQSAGLAIVEVISALMYRASFFLVG